jgi:hypothetical protein
VDIGIVLVTNFSGKKWQLNGNDYHNLVWQDESKKPTYKELEKLWESSRVEHHNNLMESYRKEDYAKESDPMFFSYQRGEVEKQDWLNKVQEIKERHPYIFPS